MRVIVVGAGQVGESIASDLEKTHEVVVVERDPDRVEELTYSLDVLAIEGNGASVDTLEEAGIQQADMVIAATDDDETNIVVCSTAKAITDAFTIARIKNTEYLRTWEHSRTAFGIDFMVCTNLLAAQSIGQVIGLPAAHDVDRFADGLVQMAEFNVDAGSPIADQTVSEADRFEELTFAAILRDGDVVLPTGDTVIAADDRLVVIGRPRSVQQFAGSVAPEETAGTAEEVVIVGGGEIGYQVAQLLGGQGFSPKLVERDRDRARKLAEQLPRSVVMQSDATDVEFLDRERVGDADVLVATLDSDEKNLLVSLLGKRLGVERTIAVIEATEYVDLFETVGVDVAINPREVVAEEITRFTRDGGAENIALIGSDRAEVVEIEVGADSVLADRQIRESIPSLGRGIVVGAITRDDQFITPRGETVVRLGDHVVLFVEASVVDDVLSKL